MARGIILDGVNDRGLVILPNTAPYNSVGSFQVIARLRSVRINAVGFQRLLALDFFTIYISDNILHATNFEQDATVDLNGHTSDVIIRARRDVANNQLTLEAWETGQTTTFASNQATLTSVASNNWSGGNGLAIGADNWQIGNLLQAKIDWYRIKFGVDVFGAPPPDENTISGYSLRYEFEDNGNDSSGNNQHLTLNGTPAFENTPSGNPPPSAPTLTGTSSDAAAFLDWNDIAVATGYELQMASNGGTDWTTIFTGTVSAFNKTGLSNGVAKDFRVLARNANGDSAWSNVVTITPNVPPPNTPVNVFAKGGYNGNVVVWNYSSTLGDVVPVGVTYNIYRATTSGGQDLNTPYKTNLKQPSYNDDEIVNGQIYYYRVRSKNSTGALSAASAEVSATPNVRTLPVMTSDDKFLFGELIAWGDRRNPYGWHDYWYETLGRQWAAQFPTRPPGANPSEKKAGTITVTNGNTQVVGVGTSFLTDAVLQEWIVPEISGVPRYAIVQSVQDNTHLTLTRPFKYPSASGVTYGIVLSSVTNEFFDKNYYDSVLVRYTMYYRTGDTYWLNEARRYADCWYNYGYWGEGTTPNPAYFSEDGPSPRGAGLLGMIARARDGRPEMWTAIEAMARQFYDIWLGPRLDYPALYFGAREAGYVLLYCAMIAKLSPNASARTEFTTYATNAAKNYIVRLQKPDGGWLWGDYPFWIGQVGQPFHIGLLLEGLQRTYELTGDVEILNSALSGAQWLYTKGFDKQTRIRATVYFVGWKPFCDTNGCTYDPATATPSNIYDARANSYTAIHQYFWAYKQTGSPKFLEWADSVFDATFGYTDMERGNIDYSPKQYGEGGRTTHRALGDRFANVDTTPPPIPATDCRATWTGGSTVKIDWEFYGGTATGFIVQRKQGSGSWTQIASVAANVRTCFDTTITTGQSYQYRVLSFNVNGNAAPSVNSLSIVPGVLIAKQVLIAAATTGDMNVGQTRQFTAVVLDQFGNALSPQPAITWQTNKPEYVSISSSGLLTANSRSYDVSNNADPVWVGAVITNAIPIDASLSNVIVFMVEISGATFVTSPAVTLIAPSYNQTLTGNVTLSANITGSVTSVDFWDGSEKLATKTTAPFSVVFDPSSLGRSLINVKARANLANGKYVETETRTVVIGQTAGAGSGTPVNQPPVVDAGTNQSLAAGTVSVTLTGTATDPDGDMLAKTWSRVSGPNIPVIASPNSLSTQVSGLVSGTYVFRLTVNDGNNPDVFDDIQVTVATVSNTVPKVTAGDKVLPFNSKKTTIKASAINITGTVVSKLWTQVSGPAPATIGSPTSWNTVVSDLEVGTYVFRFTVTDSAGTGYDDVSIVRLPHNRTS